MSVTGLIIRGIAKLILTAVVIFAIAGRIDYWQGWLFTGINAVSTLPVILIFSKKRDLLKERLKPGPGVKPWDKIWMYVAYTPAIFGTVIIGCLDTGRYGWSEPLPVSLYVSFK